MIRPAAGRHNPSIEGWAAAVVPATVAPMSDNDKRSGARRFALGGGLRATVLTTGAETGGRMDVVDGELPPGSTTPLHLHTVYEERYWVVSGWMTVWAGEDEVTLRAGDYYRVPTDVAHAVRAGPEGSRALIISSPAGFGGLIERTGVPVGQPDAEGAFDPARFLAVTAELGDVVLGPPGTTPADLPQDPVA
jgi:quercetin dioxygenase-like cupin family protein